MVAAAEMRVQPERTKLIARSAGRIKVALLRKKRPWTAVNDAAVRGCAGSRRRCLSPTTTAMTAKNTPRCCRCSASGGYGFRRLCWSAGIRWLANTNRWPYAG